MSNETNPTAEELIERAHLALVRHQTDIAGAYLQQALASDPGNVDAQRMLDRLSPSAMPLPQQSAPTSNYWAMAVSAILSPPLRTVTFCGAVVMLLFILAALFVPAENFGSNMAKFILLLVGVIPMWALATDSLLRGRSQWKREQPNTLQDNPGAFWGETWFTYVVSGVFLFMVFLIIRAD